MEKELENYYNYSPFFAMAEDMADLEWENLQDRIEKLPQTLKDFLVDSKTSDFISKISHDKNLNEDTGAIIAKIIRDVVLGDVFIQNISNKIIEETRVEPNLASEISDIITSGLFIIIANEINKPLPEKINRPPAQMPSQNRQQSQSLHEQNMGNVVDLRNTKDNG